jgi:hypothetical protein
MSGHPTGEPGSESASIEAALDNYVIAAREEELAIEKALILVARSEQAIDRANAAMAMADRLRLMRDTQLELPLLMTSANPA